MAREGLAETVEGVLWWSRVPGVAAEFFYDE